MSSNKIFITKSAMRIIEEESNKWKHLEIECGGSLVGFFINGIPVVLYATRTGRNAIQHGAHLQTDDIYQCMMINNIKTLYPNSAIEIIYLSDWHLHPMFYPQLSPLDENTCKKILYDPIHTNLPKLSIIITTFTSEGTIKYCSFFATRTVENNASFTKAELEVINENDSIVNKILGREYFDLEKITENQRGLISNQLNLTGLIDDGNGRLIKELENIRDTFNTEVIVKQADVVFWELQIEDIKCNILFPPEYPLNPPTILFSHGENEMQEYQPYYSWSSFSSITDLLKDLQYRQIGKETAKQNSQTTIEIKGDNNEAE